MTSWGKAERMGKGMAVAGGCLGLGWCGREREGGYMGMGRGCIVFKSESLYSSLQV